MSAYEDLSKNWIGDDRELRIYISRTDMIRIQFYEGGVVKEFRCDLEPVFTFLKHKLKNVDWNQIENTRTTKWGYKRLENEEVFDILNDGRRI
jgi:hypothetical protein|tara:strand:+ start:278 stop:556 length:279 start_codon:yes stop_codon:yes gene_type:complete